VSPAKSTLTVGKISIVFATVNKIKITDGELAAADLDGGLDEKGWLKRG
jgi:hypothetical protein